MPSSSICQVKEGSGLYQAVTDGVNVTPGSVITIKLYSEAGADAWSIENPYTDETSTPVTLTVDPLIKEATFTAPAAGKALIFRSTTSTNGDEDDIPHVSTFGIYTLTASGDRVLASNETMEPNATFGWITTVNAGLRKAGALPALATAYTVDLTTATPQSILANGTVTIDGMDWTYANFANTNTAEVSASGLTIAPNATSSSYTGATRTAPIISIPLSTLISGFDVNAHEVRVSVYISATNADANTEMAFVGFESASSPIGGNVMVGKGFSTNATIRSAFGVASTTTVTDDATNATDTVLILQFCPRFLRAESRTGVWSAGFPATTRPRRYMTQGTNIAGMYTTPTDLNLFLCAQSGNASNNFSVTFSAIKVEAIY